ncbi:MAG: pseudouridine synthase [Sphingobacteriaceae bacterium]
MGFTRKLQYFLVHQLSFTNKMAKKLIESGAVKVNGKAITANIEISETDQIEVNGEVARSKKKYTYIKFHKPLGYVSSLNPNVKNSLFHFFKDRLPLSIAGRLDKFSEGLLILTNDGKWQKQLTDPESGKEKEYVVTVNKAIDDDFLIKMSSGVDIGICKTKACRCYKTQSHEFKIILTEGKNKQIRRMCKTLGYSVLSLKRTRISNIHLTSLKPGEMLNFENVLQH